MERTLDISSLVRSTFLVSGTSIGAGMLGIPLVTSLAGFLPSVVMTLAVWLFMLLTGLILLEVTLPLKGGSNFLYIAEKYLGKGGKLITGFLFIFLYATLMVAYFSASGNLISQLLSPFFQISVRTALLLFFTVVFVIIVKGPKMIDRANLMMSLLMFSFLLALFCFTAGFVKGDQLVQSNWGSIVFSAPILFSAFGFHNIIPSLVTYRKKNVYELRLAIILGTTLPMLIYIAWQWLIIGSVSQGTLLLVRDQGLPITMALQNLSSFPYITIFGQCFALLAIITSVFGVGFSLVDFLADGLKRKSVGKDRFWISFIALSLPAVFALNNPAIFHKALSVAGGVGEALLNGFIPVAFGWVFLYRLKQSFGLHFLSNKIVLKLLFLISFCVICIEVYELLLRR